MQVLENESGRKAGTLLGALDRCVTPGGRRLLRAWLLRPLLHVAEITSRQDAVAALMGPAAQAATEARSAFSGQYSSSSISIAWSGVVWSRCLWYGVVWCGVEPEEQKDTAGDA